MSKHEAFESILNGWRTVRESEIIDILKKRKKVIVGNVCGTSKRAPRASFIRKGFGNWLRSSPAQISMLNPNLD